MLSDTQIILRLLVAADLGGLVGYERQRNNQPAGPRPHIILNETLAELTEIEGVRVINYE